MTPTGSHAPFACNRTASLRRCRCSRRAGVRWHRDTKRHLWRESRSCPACEEEGEAAPRVCARREWHAHGRQKHSDSGRPEHCVGTQGCRASIVGRSMFSPYTRTAETKRTRTNRTPHASNLQHQAHKYNLVRAVGRIIVRPAQLEEVVAAHAPCERVPHPAHNERGQCPPFLALPHPLLRLAEVRRGRPQLRLALRVRRYLAQVVRECAVDAVVVREAAQDPGGGRAGDLADGRTERTGARGCRGNDSRSEQTQ